MGMTVDDLSSLSTCDLCDEVGDRARVIGSELTSYGGKPSFRGVAVTIRCFEDNSLIRTAVNSPGLGRVLAIDGGGSRRCALVGDMLAKAALENGWAGLVINGCVRDTAELAKLDIGIKARGTSPRRSDKRGQGQTALQISIEGVMISPGDIIVADDDGIVIVESCS